MSQPPNPPYDAFGQYGAPAAAGYGAPVSGPFYVSVLGQEQGPIPFAQLGRMALANHIRPDTPVRPAEMQQYFPARDVPGLYSDKEWLATVLIAWLVGFLGVDRFYLGYTGLGVAKLLVCVFTCFIGGVIWGIVDLVLILLRKVPDAQGRPLR